MIEDFWQYSLALYGKSGVERAALALQDALGADVNVLLFCCYAASKQKSIDAPRLHDDLAPWQAQVVAQLRTVRRRLKAGFQGFERESDQVADLRRYLAELELAAERIEHDALTRMLVNAQPSANCPMAHLGAEHLAGYLQHLDAGLNANDLDHAAAILAGANDLECPADARAMIERAWAE